MRTIPQIIDDIGINALKDELGHRWPTTVRGWRERKRIPGDQIAAVVAASSKLGKPTSSDEIAAAMAAKPDAKSAEAA